jgi:5-(hydroxymethyl)furfural/furfural oxidase
MGMVALRGTPDDYDEWERLGAAGWGWDGVLPYFRRLERDLDFSGALHGIDGPTPVRRVKREDWTPVAREAHAYAQARQMPLVTDMNADFRDGYCALPMSNTTQRGSAAICYLDAAARARPNLTIATGATVSRLLFDGGRATGVEATIDGQPQQFSAREIILTAGALHTPAMLMRAGIGPADALRALGIGVLAHLPGVGRNLQNHPILFIGAHLRPAARQPQSLRTLQVSCFRLSSRLADCPPADLFIHLQSKSSWNALGAQIANFGPVLWKPFSRGSVSLTGDEHPLIEFNFASDERDLQRLKLGFRWTAEFLSSPAVRALCGQPFPVRFTDRLRRLNQKTPTNAWKASVVARLLNLSPALSDYGLRLLTGGARALPELVADDDALTAHVRDNVAGTFHVSGTCRIGARDDPAAVVDPAGRVHGIAGLRVADASIMPTVPRGNTNLPTIMIAEKLAAAMGADYRS